MHPMRWLARINRYVTNPAFNLIAPRLPGYAVVLHTGRRSGRAYRTPVGVTWRGPRLFVALNYGSDSDWARNVLAGGELDILHRGGRIRLRAPRTVEVAGQRFLSAVTTARR
ncbi:nitroreductase/quinone reductase family protein [Nocardia sp. NPDC051832]|uniref:nitroreductase/quinone reductase family protein n=1 Tax=Nocardia sp. NPDC051832 TaxID=3155673 RepID=UPI00341ECAF9